MLCSFTTRFRNFIWFLIFTFTLYCIPNFELLFPYEFYFSFPEAQATETQPEETSPQTSEQDSTQGTNSEASSPPEEAAAAASSSEFDAQIVPTVSFKVDDFSGAAHMSYSIAVPPGRGGLSPQLSVGYASSAGNSWIGAGWDIPIGYIQRRGPRKGAPKYDDAKDVYELNLGGAPQELVSIGNDEYRLRIEGAYLKIVYYPDPQNYWEVWDKSGTKMRFGFSDATRTGKIKDPVLKNDTYRWCLDRVEDPKANYMELIYFRDQDADNTYQIYLQKIQYNGQVSGGLPHNHEILFNLDASNRPDLIYNYRGGFKMLTQKRLSNIEVRTNGNLVRKYQFQYALSNVRSLLSSITLYGSNGTSTLPPTNLFYQPHPTGFENPATGWNNPSAWDSINGNYIRNNVGTGTGTYTDVVDMNGDALPDRVVYDRLTPEHKTWKVFFNDGGQFPGAVFADGTDWSNPSAWDAEWGNFIRNTKSNYGTYTEVIDMDGDGLPDRVVYDKDYVYDPQNPQPANWEVYLNTQTGFNATPISWQNPSPWKSGIYVFGNIIRDTKLLTGTFTDVIDMNGDGLPDRVVYDKTSPFDTWTVYFNNGSGFDAGVDWPNPSAWDDIKGNYVRNSDSFGTYTDVIDMNGDGLPDRVVRDLSSPYTHWKVYFNNGSGFSPGIDWPNPSVRDSVNGNYIRNSNEYGIHYDLVDLNGDGLPDRVVFDNRYPYNTWTVYFNNGSGFNSGVGWYNPSAWALIQGNYIRNTAGHGYYTEVIDMDGDGLPDRVVYDRGSPYNTWAVYFNNGPAPDLLSKVENGIGGTVEITYAPSTDYANTFLPFVVQTVASYTQKDGRGNSYSFEYDYAEGFYDSAEKEFRGFGYVKACQPNCQTYESMTETLFHQDYYKKGKIQTQTITSKPPQGFTEGHKKEIVNNWLLADTLGGGKFPYLDTFTTTFTDQGEGGPYTYSQTIKDVYDIRPSDLTNQTFNLLEEHKNEGSLEEIVTLLEYTSDYTNWILSKITKATVTNSGGAIASRKWMDYNADGELITEELCKSDTPNTGCSNRNPTQNVITSYQYDPTHKVLNQVTDPRGYVTTITYDSTKTFVYETTKCIDLSCTKTYKTTTEYDPGTGNLLKLISAHFQGTPYWLQTKYDPFGRKSLERLKDNPDPNADPVVDRGSTSYAYNDTGVASTQYVLKTGRIVIEGLPERTLTLNGYTYFDGLGRTYFAKTNGPDGKTIAIETQFDNIGRVWKQSNPYFIGETPYYTEFYYDGLSRLTDNLKTDGYYIHTDYEGFRKAVSKQVTASDWQSTAYTSDLNQKLVKVTEGLGVQGQETFTEYTYDILGNLTQVKAAKDASGNNIYGTPITTTMTYDSLLKKRTMTDPDMGYWTYTYDKAGNLELQTDNKGQKIRFKYDGLNRVYEKRYGDPTPLSTVYFTYDDPTVSNSKGKLTKVSYQPTGEDLREDAVLEYDLMQRVTRSKKRIGTEEKTFEKGYDSAGRVISIKYLGGAPNEKVYSYEYDVAGDLLYVKDNATLNNLVEYSDFTALGQHKNATFPKPNNVSVKTTYTYDPPTARLQTLITQKLVSGIPTETYQNLDYQQFDGAGNIKILADIQNDITHNYTYDHLNRLTLADGVGTNAYSQSYQYDRIGNVTYKSDVGTYNYTYSSKPHAVRTAGNISLQYDLNGNMTQRSVSGGIRLDITYNYDNKPGLIKKNSINHVQITYDGNSQRVKKYNYTTGQTTLYFGDLYEIRGGAETIHVFSGNQRIASVFLDGRTQFYHTNHLGSSSVITDQNGDKKEKIEYFPFGTYREAIDYDPNFPDVFYTFTGQEDDDDLGLYHYGARLYDPVLGRFISPDSIVQAPDDPQTLNRYSYARNNPIIYTDPSGNWFIIDDIIGAIASVLVSIGVCSASASGTAAALTIATTITYATVSAVAGAALGAATSAITGGNIGLGALTGAISGAIFWGAGGLAGGIGGALGRKQARMGRQITADAGSQKTGRNCSKLIGRPQTVGIPLPSGF